MLHGRARREDFLFSVEKMKSRLASWKGKLLNEAGRVTLANSVLSSIPIHAMQTMWIPENICDELNQAVHNFIWGNNEGGRGLHLVKWDTVTCPRAYGVLGIREARLSNTALLGKLVWNLIHEHEKLWVRVLLAKYSPIGNVLCQSNTSGASFTWRSIMKVVSAL